MENFEQLKTFYPKEMGKIKGWCLKNCRIGFRVFSAKFGSALQAMNYGKANGNFHSGLPPSNISVPVYCKSSSKYGHVGVWHKGVIYSDGKIDKKQTILGWDEFVDGVRVVNKVLNNSFLPKRGYWCKGDNDQRIGRLAKFMFETFPAYTNKKALGNYYGDYLIKSITEFQRRTGLYPDGMTGGKTLNMLIKYGFKQ